MNADLAQRFALTCYGNAVLAGKKAKRFWPDHSTASFCERINFVRALPAARGKKAAKVTIETPDEWFAKLREAGTVRIFWDDPGEGSDPHLAAYAGDTGMGAMGTVSASGGITYWPSIWNVKKSPANPDRIWAVTYRGMPARKNHLPAPPELEPAAAELRAALIEIRDFARKQKLPFYVRIFNLALAGLEGRKTTRLGDLAPPRLLPAPARRAAWACSVAWVFGGMGSWNDMMFMSRAVEQRYDQVTARLYQAICPALAAAANASAADL